MLYGFKNMLIVNIVFDPSRKSTVNVRKYTVFSRGATSRVAPTDDPS